jgi:hypothetical protein
MAQAHIKRSQRRDPKNARMFSSDARKGKPAKLSHSQLLPWNLSRHQSYHSDTHTAGLALGLVLLKSCCVWAQRIAACMKHNPCISYLASALRDFRTSSGPTRRLRLNRETPLVTVTDTKKKLDKSRSEPSLDAPALAREIPSYLLRGRCIAALLRPHNRIERW